MVGRFLDAYGVKRLVTDRFEILLLREPTGMPHLLPSILARYVQNNYGDIIRTARFQSDADQFVDGGLRVRACRSSGGDGGVIDFAVQAVRADDEPAGRSDREEVRVDAVRVADALGDDVARMMTASSGSISPESMAPDGGSGRA